MTCIFARFATASLFPRGRFDQWQLAYRLGGDRLDQTGMKFLAPSHTGFWADPFIAERDGRKFIFFEELSPETHRGHLAAMEVHEDGQIGEPVNVLVRDQPPVISVLVRVRKFACLWHPSVRSSGRVEVLRCERFPDLWEPHAVLLDGVAAFDPTLVEHDGLWWMFVTIQHDGNSWNDELHLFYATDVFGEWTPHALNPVKTRRACSKAGGRIISRKRQIVSAGLRTVPGATGGQSPSRRFAV